MAITFTELRVLVYREPVRRASACRNTRLPVQVAHLGGKLMLVALGGEPVVDYSLRLKRELAKEGQPAWVAGYSNLVHAYVPNRRELLEGSCEGTEAVTHQSLPGPFATDVEERIVEAVHRQVKQAREKSMAP